MARIPQPSEQAQVVDALAHLIAQQGPAPFLTAPLLRPISTDFSAPWTADVPGVERLLACLFDHVGLSYLIPVVDLAQPGSPAIPQAPREVPAWFNGIFDGVAAFGVQQSLLGDPHRLVGTLAHEVGHVYRRVHGLEIRDRYTEEALTDLTTVYLSLGLLTTNAALRVIHTRRAPPRTSSTGYAGPWVLSYALVCQAIARDLSPFDRMRLLNWLEPDQADTFRTTWAHLVPHQSWIRARLRCGDATTGPTWRRPARP